MATNPGAPGAVTTAATSNVAAAGTGVSVGAIVGAAVGGVFGLILLVALLVLCIAWWKGEYKRHGRAPISMPERPTIASLPSKDSLMNSRAVSVARSAWQHTNLPATNPRTGLPYGQVLVVEHHIPLEELQQLPDLVTASELEVTLPNSLVSLLIDEGIRNKSISPLASTCRPGNREDQERATAKSPSRPVLISGPNITMATNLPAAIPAMAIVEDPTEVATGNDGLGERAQRASSATAAEEETGTADMSRSSENVLAQTDAQTLPQTSPNRPQSLRHTASNAPIAGDGSPTVACGSQSMNSLGEDQIDSHPADHLVNPALVSRRSPIDMGPPSLDGGRREYAVAADNESVPSTLRHSLDVSHPNSPSRTRKLNTPSHLATPSHHGTAGQVTGVFGASPRHTLTPSPGGDVPGQRSSTGQNRRLPSRRRSSCRSPSAHSAASDAMANTSASGTVSSGSSPELAASVHGRSPALPANQSKPHRHGKQRHQPQPSPRLSLPAVSSPMGLQSLVTPTGRLRETLPPLHRLSTPTTTAAAAADNGDDDAETGRRRRTSDYRSKAHTPSRPSVPGVTVHESADDRHDSTGGSWRRTGVTGVVQTPNFLEPLHPIASSTPHP